MGAQRLYRMVEGRNRIITGEWPTEHGLVVSQGFDYIVLAGGWRGDRIMTTSRCWSHQTWPAVSTASRNGNVPRSVGEAPVG